MLNFSDFSNERLRKILAELLFDGGDFAEVFIEKSSLQNISCEENKIESIASGTDFGLGLRLIRGPETYYASINKTEMEEITRLARHLAQAAKDHNSSKNESVPPLKFSTRQIENESIVHKIVKEPRDIPLEEKIKLVNKVNSQSWKKDDRICQVQVDYGEKTKEVLVTNSLGSIKTEKRVYQVLALNIVAQSGTQIQTGREVLGGLIGFEIFTEEALHKLVNKAINRALTMLSAKSAPTGKMAVVLGSEAGGTMIHEAIGHSLEADAVQRGISPVYVGKIGQLIASPQISVVDDATILNMRGSFGFDDEGTSAQRTLLVENGILKNYLYDLFTARKDGKSSTGNGRRESYHFKPVPRMSNTFVTPGKNDPQEIIKSTPKGLFVKKMGGGQVNTATGDFVFEISEAYEICGGELANPIRGAILSGNGPEVLRSIDLVGNDLNFEIGTCGKEGQHVPVSDGQPTLRIPDIIVGGTE